MGEKKVLQGDNVVGFLSQIGCTENDGDTPDKKIQFEKIFVVLDSDGGNISLSLNGEQLHIKMPHRQVVMDQVAKCLKGEC